MLKKNEHGFGLVEVLLLLLILSVIGFGGYYVWHTHKSLKTNIGQTTVSKTAKPEAQNKTNVNTMPSVSPNTLVISEWGIKLTFVDASNVTYTISKQQDGSSAAALALKSTVTTIADCQDLQTALIRSDSGTTSNSVHKVGAYYYRVAGDPAPCSDPKGDGGSISQERDKILTALGNSNYEIESN